jgi:hypothetical protein
MELYGLVSIVDPQVFGDERSFREQFADAALNPKSQQHLRDRLKPLCIRTLRKQVLEYVPFTARHCITRPFFPTPDEHDLYERVSTYLQRETLIAIPNAQRQLITLVLRKLLASSTFAIANTLEGMADRLDKALKISDSANAALEQVPLPIVKWFRPIQQDIRIWYKSGSVDHPYQPDFIVETTTGKWICETKRASDMLDPDVEAKANAAALWCPHAAEAVGEHWGYLLVPHDQVRLSMTFAGFVAGCRIEDAQTLTSASGSR